MTKLERHPYARGSLRQKIAQPRHVLAQKGWKLKEKWAKPPTHRRDGFDEGRDGVFGALELRHVRDALRGLYGKRKIFRDIGTPTERELGGRHAVEGVVDLHRRKARRVKTKELSRGKVFRIEGPLPLLIRVPTRSDPDVHGSRHTKRLQRRQ